MTDQDTLPTAVQRVLRAVDTLDADAFVASFAPDGYVDDWGRQFRGPDQIRSWSDTEFIGKRVTFTDSHISTPGNPVTIATTVGGDGYNGPSHFTFETQNDQIASMTITA
jgi:hypothetical protein